MSLGTVYDKKSRAIIYPKDPDMHSSTDYFLKQDELKDEFMQKLFEKHEVENNRKRTKCFELAWDYGHLDGYEMVEDYFNELVDLIKGW